MSGQPVSALTTAAPLGRMLVPVIDPDAGPGLKNLNVTLSDMQQMFQAQADGPVVPVASAVAAVLGFGILNYSAARSTAISYYMGGM